MSDAFASQPPWLVAGPLLGLCAVLSTSPRTLAGVPAGSKLYLVRSAEPAPTGEPLLAD